MPPLTLTRPRTGGIQLLNWFDQGTGDQPIAVLADTIVPVQEMRDFQLRRFFFDAVDNVAIAAKARFVITVPAKEAWEIDMISYKHDDTLKHEIAAEWRGPFAGAAPGAIRIFLLPLDTSVNTLLFPSRALQNTAAANEDFEFAAALRLYQSESLLIQDQTGAAQASQHSVRVIAHQIPIAVEQRLRSGLIVGGP